MAVVIATPFVARTADSDPRMKRACNPADDTFDSPGRPPTSVPVEFTWAMVAVIVLFACVTALPYASSTVTFGWVENTAPDSEPVTPSESDSRAATPADSDKLLCVAVVKPAEANVSAYTGAPFVVTVPASATPENVATPDDAVTVVVPDRVPPSDTVSDTRALLEVTTLPTESTTSTTGCVPKATPARAVAAFVRMRRALATPNVGCTVCVTLRDTPLSVAVYVIVYVVDDEPVMPRFVKRATPSKAVAVRVPTSTPSPLTVAVTICALSEPDVTVFPPAS